MMRQLAFRIGTGALALGLVAAQALGAPLAGRPLAEQAAALASGRLSTDEKLAVLEAYSKLALYSVSAEKRAEVEASRQAWIEALIPLLSQDKNTPVRSWSRSILRNLGSDPVLSQRISTEVSRRALAMGGLLAPGLDDQIELLGALGADARVIEVYEALKAQKNPSSHALAQVAHALAKSKDPRSTDILLELMDSRAALVREYAGSAILDAYAREPAKIEAYFSSRLSDPSRDPSFYKNEALLRTAVRLGLPSSRGPVTKLLKGFTEGPVLGWVCMASGSREFAAVRAEWLAQLGERLASVKAGSREAALEALHCLEPTFELLQQDAQLKLLRQIAAYWSSDSEDVRIRSARLWGKLALALLGRAGPGRSENLARRIQECFVETGRPFKDRILGRAFLVDILLLPMIPLITSTEMARELETSGHFKDGTRPSREGPTRIPKMTPEQIEDFQRLLSEAVSKS